MLKKIQKLIVLLLAAALLLGCFVQASPAYAAEAEVQNSEESKAEAEAVTEAETEALTETETVTETEIAAETEDTAEAEDSGPAVKAETVPSAEPEDDEETTYIITYQDGNLGDNSECTVEVPAGTYSLPKCMFDPVSNSAGTWFGRFSGWLVGDSTEAVPVGTQITVNSDLTIKAAWEKDTATYVVRFHANGGSFEETEAKWKIHYTRSFTDYSGMGPEGYPAHLYWELYEHQDENYEKAKPQDMKRVSADYSYYSPDEMTDYVDAYAIWGNIYSITFDANGGTGTQAGASVKAPMNEQSEIYTLPYCSFRAPEGYKFAGWKVGGEIYQERAKLENVESDLVISAVWEEIVDYQICGDFTGGNPVDFKKDQDTGLYVYTAENLSVASEGWNEYEFFLTLNGVNYGAQDWVIYDCAQELSLSRLQDSGVYKLWLCNTRDGKYTFVLDPASLTLTVTGASDNYGAFLVFTELLADGDLPYYFMDDLGATDTFGDAETTMKVKVPSWDPDGYWDIQIASGGQFYGKDGLKINGAPNQIYTLTAGQTAQFACQDPHVWYDFYFGADSHKLIVKDGGRIECEIDFHVCAADGSEIPDVQILANPEAPFYEASTITVTAPEVEGYHFIGWYDSYTDEGTHGELLSAEESFEYTVKDFNYEETQALYAVYGEGSQEVSVTGITLDKTSAVMATSKTNTDAKPYVITEASTLQLTAAVEPSDAANRKVNWTSSDESIASVDENGLVTAYHYNKIPVVITATTEDGGFTATCEVQTRFNDVAGSPNKGDADYQYFCRPVYWAADHNPTITNGYETIFFGTGMNCKREDMITFLWRAAGKPGYKKASSFKDVKSGAYYYNAVMWAAENGITKGYTSGPDAGKFGVGKEITREDTVTFIYRAAKNKNYSDPKNFTDVLKGKYYYNPIMWAAEKGITNGYPDGSFGVGLNVKREDIVTFLYRAASKNLL